MAVDKPVEVRNSYAAIADALVIALFRNPKGEQAKRLELRGLDGVYLGSWNREGLKRNILALLVSLDHEETETSTAHR